MYHLKGSTEKYFGFICNFEVMSLFVIMILSSIGILVTLLLSNQVSYQGCD